MTLAQSGDVSYLDDPSKFSKASFIFEVKAKQSGYIVSMDCEKIGLCASLLGAGREKKEDKIEFSAGITIEKKTGDFVSEGDVLATLYTDRQSALTEAETMYVSAVKMGCEAPEQKPMILGKVQ